MHAKDSCSLQTDKAENMQQTKKAGKRKPPAHLNVTHLSQFVVFTDFVTCPVTSTVIDFHRKTNYCTF